MKSLRPKKTYKKFKSEKPIKQWLYYGEFGSGRWRKPLWGDYSKVEIDRAAIDATSKEFLRRLENWRADSEQAAREAFFTKKPTS